MAKYLFICWYGKRTSIAFDCHPSDFLVFVSENEKEVLDRCIKEGTLEVLKLFNEDFHSTENTDYYSCLLNYIMTKLHFPNVDFFHLVLPEEHKNGFMDFLSNDPRMHMSDEEITKEELDEEITIGKHDDDDDDDEEKIEFYFGLMCMDNSPVQAKEYYHAIVAKNEERLVDIFAEMRRILEEIDGDDFEEAM